MPYAVEGTVREAGSPVVRTVNAHLRSSGALVVSRQSESDGRYELPLPTNGEHYLVALDDVAGETYNALVLDRVVPGESFCSALLHFNGADGSTTFTDVTGKVWTPSGNAQIDTAQSVFGGASGLFDGSGDYLSSAAHADFRFAGDFTVEAWIRSTTIAAAGRCVFDTRTTSGSAGGFVLYNFGTGVQLWSNNANQLLGNGLNISANTWHHLALTRAGSTVRIFLDGVTGAVTWTTSANFSDGNADIGRDRPSNNQFWNGWIDELRVKKGIALYTANFTPPAVPLRLL